MTRPRTSLDVSRQRQNFGQPQAPLAEARDAAPAARQPCTPSNPPAMSVTVAADGLNDVYEALEKYHWDDDVEFQSGLSAILGSNSTPEQAAELALRARCFYYARCALSRLVV